MISFLNHARYPGNDTVNYCCYFTVKCVVAIVIPVSPTTHMTTEACDTYGSAPVFTEMPARPRISWAARNVSTDTQEPRRDVRR
jgi:hypothetical protein